MIMKKYTNPETAFSEEPDFEAARFEIKAYLKSDLALLYFPCLSSEAALRKLRRWINFNPSLHRARVIADYVMDLYVNGELDEVYLVYTKMENSFSMNAEKQKLLPLAKEDFIHPAPADIYQEEIKVESSMEEILEHVVPNCVTGYIYGALVESFASEHNSRMMAMQTATDSARSMISQLSIEYNRVRQAAITQQITEVIGGAKAQKNKKKK
jgi:F-type H+-transporting ATPase subunit gamma